MPGEKILIVDDSPVNARLVQLLLVHEGYNAETAADAEKALAVLKSFKPELVLADIRLPGMNGLEMTRHIKRDRQTSGIVVIALTASAVEEDKAEALAAGCNGYLTKPVDTLRFPGQMREFLEQNRLRLEEPVTDLASFGLAGPEFDSLKADFLREGLARCEELVLRLETTADLTVVSDDTHQWAGNGGLLGFPEISRLANEIEEGIHQRTYTRILLRESMANLAMVFANPDRRPASVRERYVPDHIQLAFAGKRIALVGFSPDDAERICETLDGVGALPRLFGATESPEATVVQECNLVVIQVCRETKDTAWLRPGHSPAPSPPTVFVGDRDHLLALDPEVLALASECIMDKWLPQELLLRMSFALARGQVAAAVRTDNLQNTPATAPRKNSSSARVLIADDDPIIERVLRTTLENHGMPCLVVNNGEDAVRMIREEQPRAAVLDVNMPGKNGFEVLEAIRAENLPVSVVLLTSRHQEQDVVRGFKLGADDYMTKPFNPVELVARLRRLLR